MIVAFWSSFRQSGVTSVLAAICVIWTELYGECLNVTSNHLGNDGILDCLRGTLKRERREQKKAYYCFGEPEYFRRLRMRQEPVEHLLNQRIRYLPMDGGEERDYFSGCGLKGVIERVPFGETLLIDTAGGGNKGSLQILSSADYQVHVLPKSKDKVDSFFLSCKWSLENCFFILPRSRDSFGYSREKFCEKFQISKRQVSEVFFGEESAQLIWEGELVPFLRTHLSCTKENTEYRWIRPLAEAAVRLGKFIGKGGLGECEGCAEVQERELFFGLEELC